MYVAILRQFITYLMEEPRNINGKIDAVWTSRAFEHIGDHACNTCENVFYFVGGKEIRHITIKQMEKEAPEE